MSARRACRAPVLGVDIGGVIIGSGDDGSGFWGDRPLAAPAVPGALRLLAQLKVMFDGRVHLISQAHTRVEGLTGKWLRTTGFWARTGIRPEHLHVVREAVDKAGVCQALGVTHFVDDKVEVLDALPMVARRYHFARVGPGAESDVTPRWASRVSSWPALRLQLGVSLAAGGVAAGHRPVSVHDRVKVAQRPAPE